MYDYLFINAIYSFVGSNVQQINRTNYLFFEKYHKTNHYLPLINITLVNAHKIISHRSYWYAIL